MTRKRIIRHTGLVAAALCLPLFAGSALAERGDRDRGGWGDRHRDQPRYQRDRGYDRGHSRNSYRDRGHDRPRVGFSFSFSVGDRGRGDYGHHRSQPNGSAYVVRGGDCGGYWKSVYCPPVYETYYDSCGRAYQRCVSAASWKRVWVRY